MLTNTYMKNSMKLSDEEWNELVALKNAINYNPASVHPRKMELFTELLVRSWEGKEEYSICDK
jgi:hypothetical protein